jgi:hypothetical protein
MTTPITAKSILDLAIALKPSGTVAGAVNTLDEQEQALQSLSDRVGRRGEKLSALFVAINGAPATINKQALSDEVTSPLSETAIHIRTFLSTALQTVKNFNQTVKEQNIRLQGAIRQFVADNISSFAPSDIPYGFAPVNES